MHESICLSVWPSVLHRLHDAISLHHELYGVLRFSNVCKGPFKGLVPRTRRLHTAHAALHVKPRWDACAQCEDAASTAACSGALCAHPTWPLPASDSSVCTRVGEPRRTITAPRRQASRVAGVHPACLLACLLLI